VQGTFDEWIAMCDRQLTAALALDKLPAPTTGPTSPSGTGRRSHSRMASRVSVITSDASARAVMAYRTALACDMLNKVVGPLSRFGPVVRPLVHEIIASIYQGYGRSPSIARRMDPSTRLTGAPCCIPPPPTS
jgi:hypothetical protein